MKYTVRSPEGQLTFQSFGELERAFWSGLVDPEDEVLEDGASTWRKAKSFAVLRRPPPQTDHEVQAQRMWLAAGLVLGTVALWALTAHELGLKRYAITVLAAALLAMVLFRLARGPGRKPRK
jgi:hypothetical protein